MVGRGGSLPEATPAHSEPRCGSPTSPSPCSGSAPGPPIRSLSPPSEMRPDILVIRRGCQRLRILAASRMTMSAGGNPVRAGSVVHKRGQRIPGVLNEGFQMAERTGMHSLCPPLRSSPTTESAVVSSPGTPPLVMSETAGHLLPEPFYALAFKAT